MGLADNELEAIVDRKIQDNVAVDIKPNGSRGVFYVTLPGDYRVAGNYRYNSGQSPPTIENAELSNGTRISELSEHHGKVLPIFQHPDAPPGRVRDLYSHAAFEMIMDTNYHAQEVGKSLGKIITSLDTGNFSAYRVQAVADSCDPSTTK